MYPYRYTPNISGYFHCKVADALRAEHLHKSSQRFALLAQSTRASGTSELERKLTASDYVNVCAAHIQMMHRHVVAHDLTERSICMSNCNKHAIITRIAFAISRNLVRGHKSHSECPCIICSETSKHGVQRVWRGRCATYNCCGCACVLVYVCTSHLSPLAPFGRRVCMYLHGGYFNTRRAAHRCACTNVGLCLCASTRRA